MTTKQEFNCVFCKDIFETREDLQEHFRKHGDPKFKNRFEIDAKTSDEKSKEKVELVSCDVCAQVFPTISKAITHKHKVHPDHDAKYFCPWCGKLFTMKHLYNVHVQSSHGKQEKVEGKSFSCDSCSVDFYIPSAMINHNKFFHRQDTDLPDMGHSRKVKFYEQEVIPVYYCAFCGEEYENKVNLLKHIKDDHGDENQSPDEVLKCPLCEAVFYHLDAYEIHLTFHSSEDMYSVKNPEYSNLLDYSLETVPPIIEKVENLETETQAPDVEAESTMNAVGIEKFLELAMDQSEEDNCPVKVKKHKKHKKSKKSAITLDEFLSMNQDVFGEDLDFQGIEEVPTRVVKKQLTNKQQHKNNKKISNTMVTSAELDKLKKAGIVVKRQVSRNPVIKGLKVTNSMPNLNKVNKVREIETSSEVLTKLINQSNNQIKIVKKVNPNEPKQTVSIPSEEAETALDNINENLNDSNSNIEKESTPAPKSDDDIITKNLSSKLEQSPVNVSSDNLQTNKLSKSNTNSDVIEEAAKNISNKSEGMQNTTQITDSDHPTKPVNYKKCDEIVSEEHPQYENKEEEVSDELDSDTELDKKPDSRNTICIDKPSDANQENIDNNSNHNVFNASASSLSTLKHLSHLLTVKPVSQNRNNLSTEPTSDNITKTNNQPPENDSNKETSSVKLATDRASVSKPTNIVEKNPTMDALKTLSKNITIKSLSTKRSIQEKEPIDDEIDVTEELTSNLKSQDESCNKNIATNKKTKAETSESIPNPKTTNSLINQERKCVAGKQVITKPPVGKIPNKPKAEKVDNSLPTSNANILKRLTNITTKPIVNKSSCLPSTVKQANVAKKSTEIEETKEEEIIEIFDIDDSEDEEEKAKQVQPPQPPQNSKSIDALKNLSKNITIKSLNQQSPNNVKIENNVKNIMMENTIKNIKVEKEDNYSQNKLKDESNIDTLINMQNKSNAFKNVLQGLSKNITIKSQNSSSSQFIKSEECNSQDFKDFENNEASDSDSCPGNVEITELDEDMEHDGDEEDHSERTDTLNTKRDHPTVESPKESCSENEDEDAHDFEADIKVSTVQKSSQSMNSTINSVCLNNLKNINKNITIKSLNKNSTDNEKTKQSQTHDTQETPQKKQLPTKTSNQVTKELQSDNMSINRISKNVDHASAQSWNKNVCAMNQVNTVNKEVTVKTIQTKTVIQEITTTVTKTVKTVNKTVKQEVRNSFQASSPMIAQRIQGMRPSQSKNLQGVVIRHASPMLGARTNNTIAQIRPAGTTVRPARQIVPLRTGINVARPNNPRMVVGKKITPSPSSNMPVVGRPLKISPTAVVKRPNTEDVSGPFSCFKKPKESLIPVSDIPTFASGSESTAQFTSASHTSSSNFTSTTKIVRGNSVVTAKQMKSEVNASLQQLNRLNNNTGIKVMASQHKQSQVQEHSESSPMKRTTLEAIQRLQQQGLLVKKPRVDVNESSKDSDHDGDNNLSYSSADEPDN